MIYISKKKVITLMFFTTILISCTTIQKSDPYASNSRAITEADLTRIIKESEAKRSSTKTVTTNTTKKTTKATTSSKQKQTTTQPKTTAVATIPKATTSTSTTGTSVVDKKFDETDQKIVNFIAEKVYENSEQIKQVTVDSLNKLLTEKNIRMTKREFLARTYQIIRDNNMNSFYLAAGRLLNQLN